MVGWTTKSFIDRFFQYWDTFILLKIGSVQHKTQVTTFPYGGFRGTKFQIVVTTELKFL